MSMREVKSASSLSLSSAALCLAVSLGAGCKQATPPLQPSIFTNPNEVTLVCFDARTESELRDYASLYERDHDGERWNRDAWDPTLPLDCCSDVIGASEAEVKEKLQRCRSLPELDGNAVSHALVTQVQRGEVAAVDLFNKDVLDSDKKIPGYTFVDVGALPTAIAIPSAVAGEAPRWTYVAGRENNSVRAVATCHFKVGRRCGPELAYENPEQMLLATEVALVGEPFDMTLSADQTALWVTLPDAGLLAYVPLPEAPDAASPFGGDVVYYPLPGGFADKPPAPEAEAEPYRFACYYDQAEDEAATKDDRAADMDDPTPWQREKLTMPLSVPADSTRTPRPTLMRLVDVSARGADPAEKLLFVADEGQMALHAYAQDEAGVLSLVASVPVGAPLRDFAVTPEVPVLGPSYAGLRDETYYQDPGATTRYLYAIDQRDGSLMAFSLSFTAGVPKLVPLLAPTPARDVGHRTLNRADRFSLGSEGLTARALEVVDTRARVRADGTREGGAVDFDDQHCHIDDTLGRDKWLSQLDQDADNAKDDFAATDGRSLLEQKLAQREYLLASEELSVPTNAGSSSLRGVFLMVATTSGQLSALDIHDLDLECRAKQQCAVSPDVETGVLIHRHTPRLSGNSQATVTVSPSDEVLTRRECPPGYALNADDTDQNLVCVSNDPWAFQSIVNFTVTYEAPVTSVVFNGVFEPADDGRILLKGPPGVDLCARGANAADRLLMGIVRVPDDAEKSGGKCTVTSFSSVPRMRVVEARREALLLEPFDDEIDVETALGCYNEFVDFDLRLEDQYYVSTSRFGYQHRNMSAADGTCVRDESLDPRLTSRAQLDVEFVNQFTAFTLTSARSASDEDAGAPEEPEDEPPREEDGGVDADAGDEADAGREDAGALQEAELTRRREVNPSIGLSKSVQPIVASVATVNTGRSDSLPHRVRYFADNGYLFVVDQASQGLRRFFLTPSFIADQDSVFR